MDDRFDEQHGDPVHADHNQADDRHADRLHPDSIAIRAGRASNGTALSPPPGSSTVGATPSLDDARRLSTSARGQNFYSRYANPTVNAFEDAIAALEGA